MLTERDAYRNHSRTSFQRLQFRNQVCSNPTRLLKLIHIVDVRYRGFFSGSIITKIHRILPLYSKHNLQRLLALDVEPKRALPTTSLPSTLIDVEGDLPRRLHVSFPHHDLLDHYPPDDNCLRVNLLILP